MKITYEFTVSAVCPVDPTVIDVYRATLRTDRMVAVERILELCARCQGQAIFQEILTSTIRDRLGHGELTTVGTHSGVTVTVTVGET